MACPARSNKSSNGGLFLASPVIRSLALPARSVFLLQLLAPSGSYFPDGAFRLLGTSEVEERSAHRLPCVAGRLANPLPTHDLVRAYDGGLGLVSLGADPVGRRSGRGKS